MMSDDRERRAQELIRELSELAEKQGIDLGDDFEEERGAYPIRARTHFIFKELPGSTQCKSKLLCDIIERKNLLPVPPDVDEVSEAIGTWAQARTEALAEAIFVALGHLVTSPRDWFLPDPPPDDDLGVRRYLDAFAGKKRGEWTRQNIPDGNARKWWERFREALPDDVATIAATINGAMDALAQEGSKRAAHQWEQEQVEIWREQVAKAAGVPVEDVIDSRLGHARLPISKSRWDWYASGTIRRRACCSSR
jgi:hypothetical protein